MANVREETKLREKTYKAKAHSMTHLNFEN